MLAARAGTGALGLLLSQAASVCDATGALFAKMLSNRGVDVPYAQAFGFYFVLSVLLGLLSAGRALASRCGQRRSRRELRSVQSADLGDATSALVLDPSAGAAVALGRCVGDTAESAAATADAEDRRWPSRTALLCWAAALMDVEANLAQLFAFRFVSVTTLLLLGSGGVLPAVLFLGRLCLGQRFSTQKLVGAGVSSAGYVLVVLSDALQEQDNAAMADQVGNGSGGVPGVLKVMIGTTLCAGSALLFAGSNLGQEAVLKRGCSPPELLLRMQPAAAVIAAIQAIALGQGELQKVAELTSAPLGVGAPFYSFLLCVASLYIFGAWVIDLGGAALFNMGLMMSNIYGAALAMLVLHEEVPSFLKLSGSLAVLAGLFIFHLAPEAAEDPAEVATPPPRPPSNGEAPGGAAAGADAASAAAT